MKTKSNRIEDIIEYIYKELKNKYQDNEIKSFVNILFEHFAQLNSAHIMAFPQETINESSLLEIVLATQELKKHKPIQQIIGKVDFLNISLDVNENVLIPRPETEELCQTIIQENQEKNLDIIDLCSGSGCISLSLAKNIAQSKVVGVDISTEALSVARRNNEALGLDVEYIEANILEDFNGDKEFDIIVSNPPYVMNKEKEQMEKNVLDYEPHLALFVEDENPLIFYKAIEKFAKNHLRSSGKIYLEINESLAKETIALFSSEEYSYQIVKDLFQKDRFIFLQKK